MGLTKELVKTLCNLVIKPIHNHSPCILASTQALHNVIEVLVAISKYQYDDK
eukprot:Pgem_evm1s16496